MRGRLNRSGWSAASAVESGPHLIEGGLLRVLRRLGRRIRLVADVGGFGWGLVVALGLLLMVAWLDLVVELSSEVRLGFLGLEAAAFLVALLCVAVGGRRSSRPARVAREVDRTVETGGEVLTGLDLLRSGEATDPVTEGLRRLAVRRAGDVAGSVAAALLVPLRRARRPFVWLTVAVACVAGLTLVAPRLVRTQCVRALAPWVDRPPYSPYEFLVEPGDTEVLYGDSLNVYVRFAAAKPDQLEMLVHPEGGRAEVLPLFLESDGAWRGQLRELTVPVDYTVRAPRGRTRAYHVILTYTPRLTKVTFRLTPPAYTGLPAREGPLPEKGLADLADTTVECVAESNRPLSGGDLRLQWQDGSVEMVTLTATALEAQSVRGSFVITQSGRFDLGVRDLDGLDNRTRMTGAITRLKDQRPFVRIVQPLKNSFATPTAMLPVTVEADDDFGLAHLWLYRSLNDSRDLPLSLMAEGEEAGRVRAEVQLLLALYKLSPNDVLTFYARAQDNDPNAPKGAESELVRVSIISQEDFDRLTRARANLQDLLTKYQSQARALEALRQRLEEDLEALRDLDAESREAVETMARELERLSQALSGRAQQARKLASEPPLFDLDEFLSAALRDLAQSSAQAAERVAQAAKAVPDASAQENLEEAKRLLSSGADRYEAEALQPLQALERAYSLIEDSARFATLYMRQKELARRMASLGASKDLSSPELKVRMGDLSDEQAELREQLAELLEDIRTHELLCPEEEAYRELKRSAREFVEAVEASGADEEMHAVGNSLAERDAEAAARHAANAEHILARFVAQCTSEQGMAGQANCVLRFQPQLEQGLGNTVAQLLSSAGLGLVPAGGFGGVGIGAMGGYSMQASTLDNVGLYGSSESESPAAGLGMSDRLSPAISIDLSSDRGAATGLVTPQGDTSSGAGLLQVVPLEYRKRVQEYFRRVAEETSAGRGRYIGRGRAGRR